MTQIAHLAQTSQFVWLNGAVADNRNHDAIRLDPFAQVINYSAAVISGVRVTPDFMDPGKLLIFRLEDHLIRLLDSADRRGLNLRYYVNELCAAASTVVQTNAQDLVGGGYLRAVAFDSRAIIAPQWHDPDANVTIFVSPFGDYLPSGSDFRATFDAVLRTGNSGQCKCAANYTEFALDKKAASLRGANDVLGVTVGRLGNLILTEGTTSNLFVVSDGVLVTPPLNAGVLAGITRKMVIEMAAFLEIPFSERDVLLDELPFVEEIILTGTASYVYNFTHFGRHPLETKIGVTLNNLLRRIMSGQEPAFYHLNTVVQVPQPILQM